MLLAHADRKGLVVLRLAGEPILGRAFDTFSLPRAVELCHIRTKSLGLPLRSITPPIIEPAWRRNRRCMWIRYRHRSRKVDESMTQAMRSLRSPTRAQDAITHVWAGNTCIRVIGRLCTHIQDTHKVKLCFATTLCHHSRACGSDRRKPGVPSLRAPSRRFRGRHADRSTDLSFDRSINSLFNHAQKAHAW